MYPADNSRLKIFYVCVGIKQCNITLKVSATFRLPKLNFWVNFQIPKTSVFPDLGFLF